MKKISLIILGLVALVRAFPNPQDEDLAILADIAGMTFKMLTLKLIQKIPGSQMANS
jgi:hypothetical protein